MNQQRTVWAAGLMAAWALGVAGTARGEMTVAACVREALAENPEGQAAVRRAAAARQAIREAQSAYYPQVGAFVGYSLTDNPAQAFFMTMNQRQASLETDINNPSDTDNLRAGLGAQWRLWDSGRRGQDRRLAQLGADAAQWQAAAVRNDLVHQVTRAYYGALQARAFTSVQQESVASIQESLRVAGERLKAGGAVKSDVLNLEVQMAQAREDLIRANNGLKLALVALNTAIGRDRVTVLDLVEPAETELSECKAPAEGAALPTGQRPEVRAAQAASAAGQAAVSRARREYGPTLNAFGTLDFDSDVSDDFEQSSLVGVAAEVNLFDGFRSRAGVARAQASAAAAAADERRAINQVRYDIRHAVLGVRDALERLEVTGKSLQSAEEALRIVRARYQQGAADITELLAAQVALTGVRTRHTAAKYDCRIAQSNLARAQGQLAQLDGEDTATKEEEAQ